MTRYYHFVNGMEMAVLAEATNQLHAAGYASTLDLVYSVAKQALDRLPPLYFSIKPLKPSTISQALSGKRPRGDKYVKSSSTSPAASHSTPSPNEHSTTKPKQLQTSSQPAHSSPNRVLTAEQKKQMKTAVRQAIQSMMQRQQETLLHEFWYEPSSWSDLDSGGSCLPTNCYYG